MPEIKTLKDWEQSDLDLDKYLPTPCEIDEELYLDILETVPPHYISDYAQQGGDPEDTIKGRNGEKIYIYMTVKQIANRYFYLGMLPEFKI